MQALFGLCLLSGLLTTGISLECETCVGPGDSCSGKNETCPSGLDACGTFVIEASQGGQTVTAISKTCTTKDTCAQLKPGASLSIGDVTGTIKQAVCDKALPTSASVLLALSGFLLLKVFF
ncbi:phospholipase A2 inhibitor NAI-like [Eublepharis macularius]|uniref:Phospholipase A2 inhibitor NAI-like n=1 Tax=Eublepharis macularius TaxID=481883 RepID=A0AA97LGQ1_EUBMA|nr:phospholipase A2 inhibitor NAI-like [Eublepharis macularius]XP_054855021.1 phospholipase A2 inhibitor NAI-like [Eublepharis macularius]